MTYPTSPNGSDSTPEICSLAELKERAGYHIAAEKQKAGTLADLENAFRTAGGSDIVEVLEYLHTAQDPKSAMATIEVFREELIRRTKAKLGGLYAAYIGRRTGKTPYVRVSLMVLDPPFPREEACVKNYNLTIHIDSASSEGSAPSEDFRRMLLSSHCGIIAVHNVLHFNDLDDIREFLVRSDDSIIGFVPELDHGDPGTAQAALETAGVKDAEIT